MQQRKGIAVAFVEGRTAEAPGAKIWRSRVRRLWSAPTAWSAPRELPVAIAIGLSASVLALLLRAALLPFLGEDDILISLFPILLLASLAGGGWAGSACLTLGICGEWYLYMGEPRSFRLEGYEPGILLGSLAVGVLVIAIAVLLRRTVQALRRANEHEHILAQELQHRIRNILTLVASLSRHTFRSGRPIEWAQQDFAGRLAALAAANTTLLNARLQPLLFEQLVVQSLRPFGYASDEDRFFINGPAIPLKSGVEIPFALALHELATNAAKYGAMASSDGRLAVEWWVAAGGGGTFHLRWRESGGRLVTEPESRGFGSHLIERNLAQSIGGAAKLVFRNEGLQADISAPLRAICDARP